MMIVAASPLPVFLPPASWIILTTTRPTVLVFQRGVQGNIRSWMASSSSSSSPPPSSRLQRFFLLLLPCWVLPLCCGQPSACKHRRCALQPGSLDGVVPSGFKILFINLFRFLTRPAPFSESQVTQYYQPCSCLSYRESWEVTRGGDCGWVRI